MLHFWPAQHAPLGFLSVGTQIGHGSERTGERGTVVNVVTTPDTTWLLSTWYPLWTGSVCAENYLSSHCRDLGHMIAQ